MSGLVSGESRGTASARIAASHSALVGDLLLVIEMSMACRFFGEKMPRSGLLLARTHRTEGFGLAPPGNVLVGLVIVLGVVVLGVDPSLEVPVLQR